MTGASLRIDPAGHMRYCTEEQRDADVEWLNLTTDRPVFTAEVVAEGRIRLQASCAGDEWVMFYDGCGHSFVTRAFYTTIPPHPHLLRAMYLQARDEARSVP